ncbi:MAG: DUF4118 domain-containing protein [Rhodobacteraceae bacterium]|nr:DUF4118 domain-containing protein [Paracoccaceae bacterium]
MEKQSRTPMDASVVEHRDPRVVAIFSPHPDLIDQVREASWAARERRAQLHVIVRRDGHVFEKLQGAPDETAIRAIAARYRATCETYSGIGDLNALLDAAYRDTPTLVIHGPVRRMPWNLGLSGAEFDTITSAAKAAGISAVTGQNPPHDPHIKWTLPAWRLDRRRPWFHDYVLSAFAVSLAAILVKWLDVIVPPESLAAVFLTAIAYSASAYGFAAALFASIFSVAIYDFFFLDPRFSLSIGEPQTVLLFLVFVVVAAITSNLAGGFRAQARRAERQATEARALFELTRDIAVAKERLEIFEAIVRRIEDVFDTTCILLAPDKSAPAGRGGGLKARTASLQIEYPRDSSLSRDEIEAARTAFLSGKPLGRGTDIQPGIDLYFHPLMTSDETVAVLALRNISPDTVRAPEFRALIGSICRIAGIAVERTLRARELENARVLSQTEGLRSALLSSISHDFGTPLASIIGSASSLISYGKTYTPEVTHDLLQTIMEEAERLNRFVKNVLQMNKLESGVMVPQMQWADVGDLISTALDASHRRLQNHEVYVDVGDRLPLAQVDFVLMETVIINLLDNAAKYAPAESAIQLKARADDAEITIDIADQGRGIAPEELGAVFDKFYRAKHRDRTVPGTGLGLAICKGIVEAHGGTVEALSEGLGHGTTIRIRLPVRTPDAAVMAEI